MSKWNRYNKLWVALAGALVVGLSSYFGPDAQWVQTVIAVLTALGVYAAPNKAGE